jgi:hypothetical protein
MSLPDKSALQSMDYSYFGEPFVRVVASSSINPDTLDYSFLGEPFWSVKSGLLATDSLSAYLAGPNQLVHCFLQGSDDDKSFCPTYILGMPGITLSAFLRGKVDTPSNISSFLYGRVLAIDSQPAYIYPDVDDKSYFNAFAQATVIFGSTDTTCFLQGNLFSNSSVSAYISPLTNILQDSIAVYISGVSRNIVNCFLEGKIVTTDYVVLKTGDGTTLSKSFVVMLQDYDMGTQEKAETVNKTLGGGTDRSVGGEYTTWSMIVKVRGTEPNPTFGNRDDLEQLFAEDEILFIDHRQYEHRVKISGNMKKNLVTVATEGEDAIFFYRLKLISSV